MRLPAFVRSAAGRMSRNRVLTRRLPSRLGGARVLVSPDAALSFWRWNLDLTNGRFAIAAAERHVRPGDRVFDVGANLGLFSFTAAALTGSAGSVLAIEPDPFFADLIGRSAAFQAVEAGRVGVEVLTAAVAERVGTARFVVARLGRASSHLAGYGQHRGTAGGERAWRTVVTVSLDWLAERFGPPSLVKVDVEGAEEMVLAGAAGLLRGVRPRWIVEVGPATSAAVAWRLRDAGYHLANETGRPLTDPVRFVGDLVAEPG